MKHSEAKLSEMRGTCVCVLGVTGGTNRIVMMMVMILSIHIRLQ